jgi:hypothetical protein
MFAFLSAREMKAQVEALNRSQAVIECTHPSWAALWD